MNEQQVLSGIGKKIRVVRTKKNMTQYELSQKCHIEKAGLSKIESGLSNPTIRTLSKICGALDIPVADLFAE